MSEESKQSFLVKYGPDHIRDTIIETHASKGIRPPGALLSSPMLSHKQQDELVDRFGVSTAMIIGRRNHDPSKKVLDSVSQNCSDSHRILSRSKNATKEQIHTALKHNEPYRSEIQDYLESGKFDKDHLSQMVDHYPESVRTLAIGNHEKPHLRDHVMSLVINHSKSSYYIREAAHIRYQDDPPKHILDQLVNSDNDHAVASAGDYFRHSLSADHLHTLIDKKDYYPVMKSKNRNVDHLKRIAADADPTYGHFQRLASNKLEDLGNG